MKLKLFVLLSLALVGYAQLDYNDLTSTGDWSATACQNALEGRLLSPINATGSVCSAYTDFSISLTSTTLVPITAVDTATGAPTAAFTTGRMTVNSVSYTTTKVMIRHKSEHIIHSTRGDLEMQVEMTAANGSAAAFAFVLKIATNAGLQQIEAKNPFFTATTTQVDINFANIVDMINNKIADGLFLNLLTYQGSATYPPCTPVAWYIYGTELYITQTNYDNFMTFLQAADPGSVILTTADDENSRTPTGNYQITRLCFTGYFETAMNENYGLWFGVTIIVFWFIINLVLGDKPIKDENYKENTWTHHPFVSIATHGNDIFTRKQRMALLLVTITVHALFSSAWWRRSNNRDRASNIIVFAIYSMLINWAITYIIGLMLRGYTLAKHQYYKTKNEAWDQKAQNRIFAFYFSLFIVIVIGWPFTVWNMGELHAEIDPKPSDFWVATFFVGLGLELLIIDPIVCLLAKKIGFVHSFIKGKGYFYDNLTHETYLTYTKWE